MLTLGQVNDLTHGRTRRRRRLRYYVMGCASCHESMPSSSACFSAPPGLGVPAPLAVAGYQSSEQRPRRLSRALRALSRAVPPTAEAQPPAALAPHSLRRCRGVHPRRLPGSHQRQSDRSCPRRSCRSCRGRRHRGHRTSVGKPEPPSIRHLRAQARESGFPWPAT